MPAASKTALVASRAAPVASTAAPVASREALVVVRNSDDIDASQPHTNSTGAEEKVVNELCKKNGNPLIEVLMGLRSNPTRQQQVLK